MPVIRLDPLLPAPESIAYAARLLASGELVAFPTETVYGLGADALRADAVARIFEAKGRPAWNPVIVHVADVAGARALVLSWPETAQLLANAFWPGPLTLILPKREIVPDIVTAGRDGVALRVPAHAVAQALIRAFGGPIAAPSANRFTQVSPTTAAHVVSSLGNRVGCVLDGGASEVGIESTVVDLTGDAPTILRPGMIDRRQLEQVLGQHVEVLTREVSLETADIPGQRAPGMAARHYAPNADVWLFESAHRDEVTSALRTNVSTDENAGPVVMLGIDPDVIPGLDAIVISMPNDPSLYARELYAALHRADALGARLVVIEQPPLTAPWNAIRDRLARAAR